MGGIAKIFVSFVSYRQSDCPKQAKELSKLLVEAFGEDQVFFDENIPSGTEFPNYIRRQIKYCRVVIIVMGEGWLDAADQEGNKRLFAPDDWVRLEIETALGRKPRPLIIPLRIGKAPQPKAGQLPTELQTLVNFQAKPLGIDQILRTAFAPIIRDIQHWLASVSYSPDPGARSAMLAKVRNYWIEGVLAASLGDSDPIDVNIVRVPTAVIPSRELAAVQLVTTQDLPKVFRHLGSELLILGEAGAGKTIALLQLAHELLEEADYDLLTEIPVVLHLASWKGSERSFRQWLIEELQDAYDVSLALAKGWIDNHSLTLLLDGLDEVRLEHRGDCLQKINEFRQNIRNVGFAICCRETEYIELASKLQLDAAVRLQPLTDAAVERALAHPDFTGIRAQFKVDPAFREMLQSPFMLTVARVAYARADPATLRLTSGTDYESRRDDMLGFFVRALLKKRKADQASKDSIANRLSWMAKYLDLEAASAFYLEQLQPRCLFSLRSQTGLLLMSSALAGLCIASTYVASSLIIEVTSRIVHCIGSSATALTWVQQLLKVDWGSFAHSELQIGGLGMLAGLVGGWGAWHHRLRSNLSTKKTVSLLLSYQFIVTFFFGFVFLLFFWHRGALIGFGHSEEEGVRRTVSEITREIGEESEIPQADVTPSESPEPEEGRAREQSTSPTDDSLRNPSAANESDTSTPIDPNSILDSLFSRRPGKTYNPGWQAPRLPDIWEKLTGAWIAASTVTAAALLSVFLNVGGRHLCWWKHWMPAAISFALGAVIWIGPQAHTLELSLLGYLKLAVICCLYIPAFGVIGSIGTGDIRIVEFLGWKWSFRGVSLGLIASLAAGCMTSLMEKGLEAIWMSFLWVPTGVFLGLILGSVQPTEVLRERRDPGEGLLRSLRWSLALGGGCLVVGTATSGAMLWLIGESSWLRTGVMTGGLVGGLSGAFHGGASALLRHGILRVWLWWADLLPLRGAEFLEQARLLGLLRRVGGGYIFVHRTLQDYFSALVDKQHYAFVPVDPVDLSRRAAGIDPSCEAPR